jgi:sensor histidine kinase regulating citrate/malate metabolism
MEECPIDNSTAELVAAQEVEEVFVRKDGTIFPVICAVAPLSKSGRTVGAVIEFRDVTEERRRENERLSALREAEVRARMHRHSSYELALHAAVS